MRIAFKGIAFVVVIGIFCVVGRIVSMIIHHPKYRAWVQSRLVCWVSRLALFAIGIQITNSKQIDSSGPRLIVANHLSYVDILIIASRYPAIFVTSQEVADDKFLGAITRAAGCLFVERRHPFRLPQEIQAMRELLKMNVPVAFFPEGTTTDGKSILKFKSSLFQAGVDIPGLRVTSLCLKYTHADGEELTDELGDHIFYYGDHTFAAQFKKLLSLRNITVSLEEVGEFEIKHRKLTALHARRQIMRNYFYDSSRVSACAFLEYPRIHWQMS